MSESSNAEALAALDLGAPIGGADTKLAFILGYLRASAVAQDPVHPEDCAALVVAALQVSHGIEMGAAMVDYLRKEGRFQNG